MYELNIITELPLEIHESYLSDDQNENFSNTPQTTQPVPNQETNVNVNSDHNHQWDNIVDVLLWLHEDPTEEVLLVLTQEDQDQSPEIAQAILTPENNVRVELYWQDDQNENFSNTSLTIQPDPNQVTNANEITDQNHQWDNIADVLWLHEYPPEEVLLVSTQEDQDQSPEIAQVTLPPENNVRVELYWQNDQNEWEHIAFVLWQPVNNPEDEPPSTFSSAQPLVAIEGPQFNTNNVDNWSSDWENNADLLWLHDDPTEEVSLTSTQEDQDQLAEISQVNFPLVVWRPENNVSVGSENDFRVDLHWLNNQNEWEHIIFVLWQPDNNPDDESTSTVSSAQPLLAIEGPAYTNHDATWSSDQSNRNNIPDVVL